MTRNFKKTTPLGIGVPPGSAADAQTSIVELQLPEGLAIEVLKKEYEAGIASGLASEVSISELILRFKAERDAEAQV